MRTEVVTYEHREAPAEGRLRALEGGCVPFDVIECIRYSHRGGLRHLDRHLARLVRTAQYFRFQFDEREIRDRLTAIDAGQPVKVRVALSPFGDIRIDLTALEPLACSPLVVAIDSNPVRSDDIFLLHKTSNRDVYRAARARFPSVDDVIMVNERREVTESTIANVAVRMDGAWWTPPLSSGCLPGVERGASIDRGQLHERVLSIDDLYFADSVTLLSSVRGWRPARVQER